MTSAESILCICTPFTVMSEHKSDLIRAEDMATAYTQSALPFPSYSRDLGVWDIREFMWLHPSPSCVPAKISVEPEVYLYGRSGI